jgi:hypothetical protein
LKSPHVEPLPLKDIKIDAWVIIISYGSNLVFQISSVHDLFHEILLQARIDHYPSSKGFHAISRTIASATIIRLNMF